MVQKKIDFKNVYPLWIKEKTFVQHIQIAQGYMTFEKCFEKIKDVTQLYVEQKLILLKHVVFLRLGKSIDLLPGKYRVREHH